jgi:hypothetical protein
MNQQEVSFRSDEQAQSQDRERLQEDIEAAWRRIYSEHIDRGLIFHEHEIADIKLLKWALGVK